MKYGYREVELWGGLSSLMDRTETANTLYGSTVKGELDLVIILE